MTPAPFNPLRFSRLRLMAQSAAHFAHGYGDKSRAMDVGSASHSLILGGAPVVGYLAGKARRGKEYDTLMADQDPAAIVLTADEFVCATAIQRSVTSSKAAMSALDGCRESTIVGELYGFPARGTPDARGAAHIGELKTGETADPRRFPFKLMTYAHHAQLAWYGDLAEQQFHGPIHDYYIVAVEQKAPFVCTVFKVGQRTIEQGRKLTRLWAEQLRVCVDSNHWPGYVHSVAELELPEQDNGLIFEDTP